MAVIIRDKRPLGPSRQVMAVDPITGDDVDSVGDSVNNAVRVNVVAGGGGGGGGGSTPGPFTDGSGSIAIAATSQALFAASATRKYLLVTNISTDTLWINFGIAAIQDQPSVPILTNGSFVMEGSFINNQAINIIGPNAGAKFTAKQG